MANQSDFIANGDYVRIDADYDEPSLRGQTGTVVAGPNTNHPNEYKVLLEGGIALLALLAGKEVWIPANALQHARRPT